MRTTIHTLAAMLVLFSAATTAPAASKPAVDVQVDWPGFLARHDLIWDKLPTDFDSGAFLGNGMLGATIYQDGPNRLRFEMGRADVTEHRRDNARLPIGGLVITTSGKIQGGTMRLDLWNAEVRGTITTDKGNIGFHCYIHAKKMVMVADMEGTSGEHGAWSWDARPCVDRKPGQFAGDAPNPPSRLETDGAISVCVQPRAAGGEFATAWTKVPNPNGAFQIVALSIADSFPNNTAKQTAVKAVREADDNLTPGRFRAFEQAHRDWWHAFYPTSFVSIPDPKLEGFYWIQWYKLACASRPDSVPVDLLGPWFRNTGWPRIWWNLNIETLYLPVYTGNRLQLGESFIRFLDTKRDNFFRNGKQIWKFDACATVPHTTDYEGLRGDGDCAPDMYVNPGDFTWALHNYYLHYRYTMDRSLVTDHNKHAFYPLLRGSINLYLKLLKKGDDGKLHLPVLMSPEYGSDADNNYNLSLLRWGCQTLLDLNQRYQLKDPLIPLWETTLKELVPYPVDDHGLRIGAKLSFTQSHRHWSHLLMVHPLHIMTADNPAERELLNKSVLHWLTTDGARGINGWSRAAAASLYATLGDGDNAIQQIHQHMADARFVRSNTMYIEGSPVIECSIVLNRSLQDMLLQSWGEKINIFPAVPAAWKDAVFHDLRAEGAFLVSAGRKDGAIDWVRIKSLAGEQCRVQAVFASPPKLWVNSRLVSLKPGHPGIYDLPLAKGDEALLSTGDAQTPIVKPMPMAAAQSNLWGGRGPAQ